jgi:hypothetical protein
MDRTQRIASFAGLVLVTASLVGAVVSNQGPGDVMLSQTPASPTEAVVAVLADGQSEVSAVDGYGEEPEGNIYDVEHYDVEQYDHQGDHEEHEYEELERDDPEYEGGDNGDAEGDRDDE